MCTAYRRLFTIKSAPQLAKTATTAYAKLGDPNQDPHHGYSALAPRLIAINVVNMATDCSGYELGMCITNRLIT
jgi:hypothetical protein